VVDRPVRVGRRKSDRLPRNSDKAGGLATPAPADPPASPEEFTLKSLITAAVASLAVVATAGSASAQHDGGHGGRHVAPAHHPVAPVHHGGHPSLGHTGYPAARFGVGVSVGPVYGGAVYGGGFGGHPAPVYGPVLAPAHGYRHVPHHRSHH
jgi:hypothetical protein